MSVICQAFGIAPNEALRQDPRLVFPVLEYRLAVAAREQFNQDSSKMSHAEAELMGTMAQLLENARLETPEPRRKVI